jgi:hypothetical protein
VFRIIGVVEDFHFESLHLNIRPLAIYLRPEREWFNRMALRIRGDEMAGTIQYIENKWNEMVQASPSNTVSWITPSKNFTATIIAPASFTAFSASWLFLWLRSGCWAGSLHHRKPHQRNRHPQGAWRFGGQHCDDALQRIHPLGAAGQHHCLAGGLFPDG